MYDAQRNEQFQTLQNRLAETEGRLAASSGTPSFSEQQQQDIDRLLMQSKQKVEEAEQEKMKVGETRFQLMLGEKTLFLWYSVLINCPLCAEKLVLSSVCFLLYLYKD